MGFYQISAKYISTIHLLTGLLSTRCNHSHLETSAGSNYLEQIYLQSLQRNKDKTCAQSGFQREIMFCLQRPCNMYHFIILYSGSSLGCVSHEYRSTVLCDAYWQLACREFLETKMQMEAFLSSDIIANSL